MLDAKMILLTSMVFSAILCMLMMSYFVVHRKRKGKLQLAKESQITKSLMHFLSEATYDQYGTIDPTIIRSSGVIRKQFNTVLGEHYIRGKKNGVTIEAANLELLMVRYCLNTYYDLVHEEIPCFSGSWVVITLSRHLADYMIFVGNEYWEEEKGLHVNEDICELEDKSINQCYQTYIYGDHPRNQQISWQMQQVLLSLYELYHGSLKVLVNDNRIHIITNKDTQSVEMMVDRVYKINDLVVNVL